MRWLLFFSMVCYFFLEDVDYKKPSLVHLNVSTILRIDRLDVYSSSKFFSVKRRRFSRKFCDQMVDFMKEYAGGQFNFSIVYFETTTLGVLFCLC